MQKKKYFNQAGIHWCTILSTQTSYFCSSKIIETVRPNDTIFDAFNLETFPIFAVRSIYDNWGSGEFFNQKKGI